MVMLAVSCTSTSCCFGLPHVPSIIRQGADIATVTENPGVVELREGEPLRGPAGGVYNECLGAAGINRAEVSILNVVGCTDMNREVRNPLPAEIAACEPRLLMEIELADPKVILVMGATAMRYWFPNLGENGKPPKVGKVRGHIRAWEGRLVVATYHPAAALPNRNPELKELITADMVMCKVLAKQVESK